MKLKFSKKKKENSIEFVDDYIYGTNYSDKFDSLRVDKKKNNENKLKFVLKYCKAFISLVLCVALVCFGYFAMNVHMERRAYSDTAVNSPVDTPTGENTPSINDVKTALNAKLISSDNLDGSTVTQSIVNNAANGGYDSVVFDLKREDGTLAYDSNLTEATTYKAVASPAKDIKSSVETFLNNSITPVARVYCFKDSIAGKTESEMLLKDGNGKPLNNGNSMWLDPSSERATKYLLDIIKEINSLGIKNIILDGLDVPNGDTEKVSAFLADIKKALGSDVSVNASAAFTVQNGGDTEKAIADIKASTALAVITTDIEQKLMLQMLTDAAVASYILITDTVPVEQ